MAERQNLGRNRKPLRGSIVSGTTEGGKIGQIEVVEMRRGEVRQSGGRSSGMGSRIPGNWSTRRRHAGVTAVAAVGARRHRGAGSGFPSERSRGDRGRPLLPRPGAGVEPVVSDSPQGRVDDGGIEGEGEDRNRAAAGEAGGDVDAQIFLKSSAHRLLLAGRSRGEALSSPRGGVSRGP